MKPSRLAFVALLLAVPYVQAQDRPTFDSNPFVPLPFPLPPGGPPPNRQVQRGPWQNDLLVFRTDASGRAEQIHTFERAGVPTLTRLTEGRIMAAFQNFPSNDPGNFDRVAVSFSSDEGATWSKPQPIAVEGMEAGLMRPFDPTLVTLADGRIRLYFTSNRSPRFEESTPAIYSAISDDGIRYQFETGVRFAIEDRVVIDCAACLHDGIFHLIVPDNGTPEEMRRESESRQQPQRAGNGYHATSKDGLNFERVADVKLDGNVRWLGNLESDGAKMTFIGTGNPKPPTPGQRGGGLWMATSADGATWTLSESLRVPGADPGAVKLKDGSWLVIATGPPRR